jgi:UDP-N-acetylmuramoyl-tripeptide--D-alanyl-D-alanine ligase
MRFATVAHETGNVLFTFDELLKGLAPAIVLDGEPQQPVTGFSIDTRSLQPGNVFIALKDGRDGHEFVTNAFKAGASAAIVAWDYQRKSGDGALIRCNAPMFADMGRIESATPLFILQGIGALARDRLSTDARVIAVTGSAGKTGTKEMLRACLSRLGKVHASEKSFNNHWGVPLTLANMPRDSRYGVFEIGMNHAGEIAQLVPWVRPHAAIVTTVEAVHLEHFANVEAIADAKGEIFSGLVSGGAAIINRDNPHYDRLRVRAQVEAARVVSFGVHPEADVRAEQLIAEETGSDITARVAGRTLSYRLAIPGRHIAQNSLGVVAALDSVGADLEEAVKALATLAPPPGRGARDLLNVPGGQILLIDESYNANPASMRASLATLGTVSRDKFPRRIAVLGDMLELGSSAGELHRGLLDAVISAGVDQLFACGPYMKGLYDAASPVIKGGYAETAQDLSGLVVAALRPGDAVMVKGSNGMRLGPLAASLRKSSAAD